MQAVNGRTDKVIADKLTEADTFFSRLKGLLGKSKLEQGEGLLIIPCNQVHMKFMRFPLSIWFLDDTLRLISCIDNLGVGEISPKVLNAYMVLELPAYSMRDTGTEIGDTIFILD